jgi:hypothetical protein
VSFAETSPALKDEPKSSSEGQNTTRQLCSADIFDFKSKGQTLLALAEGAASPVAATELANPATPAEAQEQQKPRLSEQMENYVEQMAKAVAARLDLGTRHDEVIGALQKAARDIKKTEPDNATAIYTELMRRIDKKEAKFKGEDLNIKIDNGTKKPKYVSVISGELNKQAKLVAQLLDSNAQQSAYQILNQFTENKPDAEKLTFAIAVDAHEKDEPFDDFTITFNENNQPIGYKANERPTDQERMAVEAAKEGKKAPKDGEAIPFKELLSEYKTSFGDAYARSKMAADDDPAKSKTLEEAIKRLERSINPVKVVFSSNPETSFDFSKGIITIDSRQSASEQIETFVHEAYHATHQGLKALFMGDKLSKEDFVKLKGNIEAECFEASIKVNQELTSKMGSPSILFPYIKDGQRDFIDLAELYSKQGKAGLFNFIMDNKTDLAVDGKIIPFTYRDHFSSQYAAYANNVLFERNANRIRDAYNKYPAWRELIDDSF